MVHMWPHRLFKLTHGTRQVFIYLLRNYLCNDMIRRVMRDHFGYNIQYCMNITDVDDKIINNSNQEGIEYFEFARKWEKDYFEDME